MDHVYAKVQRQRIDPYRRVLSDVTLYEDVDINASLHVPYDPATNLDDGEWFALPAFAGRDYSLDVLRAGIDSSSVAELTTDQFDKITYIMAVQDEDFYFQRIKTTSFIRRKSIVLGDIAVVEEPRKRIIVNAEPDAIYLKSQDLLLFRDLVAVSAIFKDIGVLFREATDDQVQQFLDQDFVLTDLDVGSVSKPNRKRIALALETLDDMSIDERKEVVSYIKEYGGESLQFDEGSGQFLVQTDDELKMLAFGIEQRFYTTRVRSERRLANSVVKL